MTTRRQFLQGTTIGTGSLLLAPIFSQLKAQAAGAAKLPPRFVFMVEGNGLPPKQITPLGFERVNVPSKQASGRGVFQLVNESLVDRELPPALQPIKQYQDRLTVVNGLSGRVAGGGHSNNFGALGVYNCKGGVGNSGAPVDETIDVAIGKQLGGIFPHVGIGMVDRPNANVIYNCSAWGKGQPTPTICQPMTAYGSLFGSVAGGNSKAEFHARTNLLDFLAADVRRLQKEVPRLNVTNWKRTCKGTKTCATAKAGSTKSKIHSASRAPSSMTSILRLSRPIDWMPNLTSVPQH